MKKVTLCSFVILLVAVNSLSAINDPNYKSPSGQGLVTKPRYPKGISVKALEILKGPWKETSFDESLSVVQDKSELLRSRQLLLAKLESEARQLNVSRRRRLLAESTILAKNKDEPPILSAQAIGTMSNVALMMHENGEITRDEAISEKDFLINVAADKKQDLQFRASAIKAFEVLKMTEAIPVLKLLLSDVDNFNVPELARSGSLSLTRLTGTGAFPYVKRILDNTLDERVFETAAYCMGQIKTADSVAALIKNRDRFVDSGACDFALVDMEEECATSAQSGTVRYAS